MNETIQESKKIHGLDSSDAKAALGEVYEAFCEEIILVKGASHEFSHQAFLEGKMTPVYFGSAINNFGVDLLLDAVAHYAPPPQPREGRIRTKIAYSKDEGQSWHLCNDLYSQATPKPTYLGKVLLTKNNQLSCEMYLYKEKPLNKKRKHKKRRHNNGKMIGIYRKSHQAPWLLVTSIPHKEKKAACLVKAYQKRMKIEQEFRNTKDRQWGIGLSYTRTLNPKRLEILLLIGALALFMLWLIG